MDAGSLTVGPWPSNVCGGCIHTPHLANLCGGQIIDGAYLRPCPCGKAGRLPRPSRHYTGNPTGRTRAALREDSDGRR